MSSFNSSSLLATETANVELATSTNNSVRESSTLLQGITESLNTELSSIGDTQMAVDEVEVNATQSLVENAQLNVSLLQDLLRGLTLPNGDSVINIEALLTDVTAELSEANISGLSALLRQQITDQRLRRESLEASVNRMQQQVDYLGQIHASLPTDCPS